MNGYVLVFLGAGFGGAFRHGVNLLFSSLLKTGFPLSTMAVNIAGSFLMGILAGWFAFRGDTAQGLRLFLVTGFLGGFTTFSTFSLDVALLYERSTFPSMVVYMVGSVVMAVAGLAFGLALMRAQ